MPRLEPAIAIYGWRKLKLILPPCQDVPCNGLIRGSAFGLKRNRMACLDGRQRVHERNAVLRVTVDAFGIHRLHLLRQRGGPWLPRIARTLIPHHHGEKDFHAMTM